MTPSATLSLLPLLPLLLLLSVDLSQSASIEKSNPSTAYPCNESMIVELNNRGKIIQNCLSSTLFCSDDRNITCKCTACVEPVKMYFALYETMVETGECAFERDTLGHANLIISYSIQYPCLLNFIRPNLPLDNNQFCADPSSPLCGQSKLMTTAGIPASTADNWSVCKAAMKMACSTRRGGAMPPWCQAGCDENGVCSTVSTNTLFANNTEVKMSVYDLECNPTSPYSSAFIASGLGMNESLIPPYSVALQGPSAWGSDATSSDSSRRAATGTTTNQQKQVAGDRDLLSRLFDGVASRLVALIRGHDGPRRHEEEYQKATRQQQVLLRNNNQKTTTRTSSSSVLFSFIPARSEYMAPPVLYSDDSDLYDITACMPGMTCTSSFMGKCPGGFYCPDPWGMPVKCEDGYFCPSGSAAQKKCAFLDFCDGSVTRTQLGGCLVAALVLIFFLIVYAILKFFEVRKLAKYRADLLKGQHRALKSNNNNNNSSNHGLAQVDPEDIEFENIVVKTDTGKLLLNDVSGVFRGGEVSIILGTSGAGKSTLMDALMGTVRPVSGTIRVGEKRGVFLSELGGDFGFVPQHDCLIPILTVRENLEHAAFIRLPSSTSASERSKVVDSVLAALNLIECEHTVVGSTENRGVSGGQRKRVSIGVELVANPRVLFLDEPTTGLDASSALELQMQLKVIARTGRTVVSVVHTPRHEVFANYIDTVCLMTKGRLAYCGPAATAADHFLGLGCQIPMEGNPAENLLDLLNGSDSSVLALCQQWADRKATAVFETPIRNNTPTASQDMNNNNDNNVNTFPVAIPNRNNNNNNKPPPSLLDKILPSRQAAALNRPPLPSGLVRQFVACFYRQLRQRYRSPVTQAVFVGVHIFCGFVLGVGFLQSDGIFVPPVPAPIADLCPPSQSLVCKTEPLMWGSLKLSAFFLSLALGSAAMVASVYTFGDELEVFSREARSGASTLAYFWAKSTAEVPFLLTVALVFTAVYIPMLQPNTAWGLEFLIFFGVEIATTGMGYFLSTFLQTQTSHVVGVVLIFAFSICSGISPKLREVPSKFGPLVIFWWISFPMYAVQAAVSAEADFFLISGNAFEESTRRFASEYGFVLDSYWLDVLGLIVIGIVFRILACFLLWWRHSA